MHEVRPYENNKVWFGFGRVDFNGSQLEV